METPRALLQARGGRTPLWLEGVEPLDILTAHRIEEVRGVVERAETAAEWGSFVAGYLSYEAAPAFDPRLAVHAPGALPLAAFVVFAHCRRHSTPPLAAAALPRLTWRPGLDPGQHAAAVATIHAAIARGETYQANLTYRLQAGYDGDPAGWLRGLWEVQRPAHAAYFELGRHALVSVSPESFFRRRGTWVAAQPMKGTAARGRTNAEDAAAALRLASSDKERAENLMIVDMVRNDLGRVALPGSVRVPRLFTVERYPTLWQLSSTVTAETTVPTADLLAALFPSASITGAPKAATMRLLRELEAGPRGIYTGAIGWLARGRRAAFNVAIRTLHHDRTTGLLEYGTGGGIVWDSRPDAEYRETRTKALILLTDPAPFRLLAGLRVDGRAGGTAPPRRLLLRIDRQLARLADAAAYFDYPCDLPRLREQLLAAAAGLAPGPHHLRLELTARGTAVLDSQRLTRDRRPWRLAWAPEPIDTADPHRWHKTSRRQALEAARAAWPDHDDVVLWNRQGEVTETTRAHLALRLGGRWWTPARDSGLLAGTVRDPQISRRRIVERRVGASDLAAAEDLLIGNAVRGLRRAHLDPSTLPDALR